MGRKRHDYTEDRMTRHTKVEFSKFDGNKVHDRVFKSERFFELDGNPPTLKVSLTSVHLTGLAME